MTKIHFIKPDGTEQIVEATDGNSLMETAKDAGIEEVVAECGGSCSCVTCHVYIDAGMLDRVGAPSSEEDAMLDFNDYRQDNSRLSCQIRISPELEGLRVILPESQY